MLPSSRIVPGQPRGVGLLQYARVSACHAYFPHYRQNVARSSRMLSRPGPARRRHMQRPDGEPSAADQAAAWLISGQWKQQLEEGVPQLQQKAQAGVQSACLLLAGAHQQAQAMWQYVLLNWPAWKASLQEDAEIVLEYALGYIPAWLAVLYASALRACLELAASAPVQQLVTATAAAVAAAEASAVAVTEAAQRSMHQTVQLVQKLLPPRSADAQSADQRTDEDDHHQFKRGSRQAEAARVAYSIAFFGWGLPKSSAQQLAQHSQQMAQHMSLYEWQQQQQEAAYQPRRWRKAHRREWVERVVNRARRSSATSSSSHMHARDHHAFRPRDGAFWAASVRQVTGALAAAQQGVQGCVNGVAQGCVEAVHSVQATSRAAVGGVQRAGSRLVTPVQQAVQRMEPPPAGVVAAGVVLLAGAITSTMMRRQKEAAQVAQQQRQIMQQSAEQLRAQKARIMGVLSVEVPSGSATGRRKGTAPPSMTSIPITVAGADSTDSEADDAFSADAPVSGSAPREMQMDPEAAAMWKKFLAGSRAMDVPMWDNRMVEDLPKVSRKEVDKQTQKIRSAAAPEERAAIEQADMEQLSRQLQQLDHAPIGRAARAAWLNEQQQKRQLQQQAKQGDQAQNAAGNRSSSGSPASDRPRVRGGDDSNPFAIPQEVRANWDADLEDEPRAAAPRRQISRTAAPSSDSSRSGSRNGDRSSPGAGSDNPFAIPQEARKQWQAEDHMFSEAGKPILGGVLGGLVKLTSGKAQPSTAQLHQERRRQAMKAEEIEAAAILRLQQQEEQQQQARPARAPVAPQGSARTGLPPRAQQQQQPAAADMPAAAPQAPAAAPAAAAAAAPSGFEGLEEGSPEWAEKMRQEMLKNGAARRARMQQMRAQGGPASQPRKQLQQAAATSSSTLSSVSAADAQGVTAAIPTPPPQQKAPATQAGPAMAAEDSAAASSDRQKADQSNTSAV